MVIPKLLRGRRQDNFLQARTNERRKEQTPPSLTINVGEGREGSNSCLLLLLLFRRAVFAAFHQGPSRWWGMRVSRRVPVSKCYLTRQLGRTKSDNLIQIIYLIYAFARLRSDYHHHLQRLLLLLLLLPGCIRACHRGCFMKSSLSLSLSPLPVGPA